MTRLWEEPSAEAYQAALTAIRPSITAAQLHMLEAHFLAPHHRLTSIDLARAAGFASYHPANHVYARLGKNLRVALGLPIKDGGVLTGAFVDFPEKTGYSNHWV